MRLRLLMMNSLVLIGLEAMEDATGRESSFSSLTAQPPTPTLAVPIADPFHRKKTAEDAVFFFENHSLSGGHKAQNCQCNEYRKTVNLILLTKPPFVLFGRIRIPRWIDPVGAKFRVWASENGWYEGITKNND